ncbi:HEAT repeat domain-containing protein [Coleofasciculus sp. FACHB-1120]|uniref:HEAT repeat domain-containing protein n=1 Tax=Coleofasciculus sp. FACHB-1120 TaxID=2692783 RepID=UPI001682257E|nr:HEAT repeat domain-containing protein [Coleofasciculus sp. FACHB-1120]MBD2741491.1 WGR domain-containing protein [Coleofasciculus sp. FACHB-1120]
MELIQRTTLLYQAGSSDKVYEVDLCKTGENRYLVNFRYGRRGTTLKEGTKTVQAVPLAQAQRVFDKLIDSQIQKGYRDVTAGAVSEAAAPAPVQTASNVPVTSDPRHQAILNRLANRDNRKWPLERAIWRAGELKIGEATPLLIQLIRTGEPLRDYCIAWALGWCGDESAIPFVRELSQHKSVAEFVRRIAWEALFKLSDEQTQGQMRSEKIEQLPLELRDLARNGTAEAFATTLRDYLNSSDYRRFAVLDTIYQIDNEYVRPALLDILCETPFKSNYFQRIRHIFKMAEYRHDAEVFGILAYAFEKEPGTFNNKRTGWQWDSARREYYRTGQRRYTEELKSPQSNKVYSQQTREYLRRRVWRTLKTLGEESDSNYINLAVNILLQYSDDDAQPAKQSTFRRWNGQRRSYESFTRGWDTYAGYVIFNHILYENSPRYASHHKAWRCRDGYKPGDPEPKVREEAFPELWQQNPAALVQLLIESDCRPVHHFAVKALRVCKEFCDRLDTDTLIKFLNKPYAITAEFGFLLARDRYNPAQPNSELVLALANCAFQEARTQAYRWIEQQREFFFESSDFIAGLVTSQQADTRSFARRLLSSSILTDTTARVLIGRIIAAVLVLEPTQTDMSREISETLLLCFAPQLCNLGLGVILDLLNHPMPEIQELGARILLNHDIRAVDLPPDLIELLLSSPYESVRGIGVRIFGQLPDERLLSDRILIVSMAINAVADIRNAIRPVIRRLAANNPNFATELASDFIDVLITPERHEGVHKDVVQLMREDIPGWMSNISKERAMQLLRAKSSVAQELGGLVLRENSDRFLPDFETSEIVKLANHEILSVREAAREMFLKTLNRIRTNSQEMLSAVRLLESKWDDSREFASRIFSTDFTNEDWTPEVMVSVCDSIREDVRSFGRDLVTRNFKETDGQEYLLKFSEHPSTDMQTFATNYLENHAVNNSQRLRDLTPYFISVLSGVNRGRVSKQRIFAFLDTEAQKSEEAAQIVTEILTRQSVTMAIGDKATAIQIMLKIQKAYPQISLPIQVKAISQIRN